MPSSGMWRRVAMWTYRLHNLGEETQRARNNISSNYYQKHTIKKFLSSLSVLPGFYIQKDNILHSHSRENWKPQILHSINRLDSVAKT
jgi:hypothetical protein